jgi:hypothetical protein
VEAVPTEILFDCAAAVDWLAFTWSAGDVLSLDDGDGEIFLDVLVTGLVVVVGFVVVVVKGFDAGFTVTLVLFFVKTIGTANG